LIQAYKVVQEDGLDLVVVFFQLPFRVRLPEKWIKIQTDHGNPFIYFRTIGTSLNTIKSSEPFQIKARSKHGNMEMFTNAMLPNDFYGQLTRTQAIISFQLWGRTLARYPTYLEMLQDPKEFRHRKIYPAKGVLSRHPLTGETYEIDLADRPYKETIKILEKFIPAYAVSCVDPFAQVQEDLDSYFIMVKTGRVVARAPKKSIIAQFARPFEFQNYSGNFSALRNRLESGRPPSIYETYLLEAARQVELGASNLAIVQTVMILDLFANEIINDRLLRKINRSLEDAPNLARLTIERMWESKRDKRIHPSTLDKFTKYFPTIGLDLTNNLKGDLSETIKLRNKIVHRIQAKQIDEHEAKRAIHTGLSIIQHCMSVLLSQRDSK
jgi:hypothetical protein